jgi:hypothetical protein
MEISVAQACSGSTFVEFLTEHVWLLFIDSVLPTLKLNFVSLIKLMQIVEYFF